MSKTLNSKNYLRLALLVTAIGMLCFQSHTAFLVIMDPPMIVTTREDDIKNVAAPLHVENWESNMGKSYQRYVISFS